MTYTPEIMPSRPRTILFVAYPQVGLLDLTGAQTVFWAASKAMRERNLPVPPWMERTLEVEIPYEEA